MTVENNNQARLNVALEVTNLISSVRPLSEIGLEIILRQTFARYEQIVDLEKCRGVFELPVSECTLYFQVLQGYGTLSGLVKALEKREMIENTNPWKSVTQKGLDWLFNEGYLLMPVQREENILKKDNQDNSILLDASINEQHEWFRRRLIESVCKTKSSDWKSIGRVEYGGVSISEIAIRMGKNLYAYLQDSVVKGYLKQVDSGFYLTNEGLRYLDNKQNVFKDSSYIQGNFNF